MDSRYAVLIYRLAAGDEGFDRGARLYIEDVDGDRFYARTEEAVTMFMEQHGMIHVGVEQMQAIRHALRNP